MKHVTELNPLWQFGTVIGSGGTVTSTGIDWSVTYEPQVKMVVSVGATPSGTVVATLQQGTALAAGYSDVGTINTIGTTGGTAVYEYDAGSLTARYLRVVATCTGGTALASASLIGKPYTVS
jgi:hypothetical protein